MTNAEIVIALISSNGGVLIISEVIKSIRRGINKKKGRGLPKLEADIEEMKASYNEIASDVKTLSKDLEEIEETARKTDLVLLHDRIWQIYRVLKDRPEITVEEDANIDYLYGEYKKKGGNHKARSMYRFLKNKKVVGGLVDEEDDEEEVEDFLK